jgi:predicted 3-demethylubiquinone-9 3-methyltransferase (glyoxalase superfamily)
MQKITTFLWFDTQAEEAAKFYTSIFPNSKILEVSHYGEGGPRPADMVLVVRFSLDGQEFMALNGGPEFKFSEAVSLYIHCADQAEVDHYWSVLTDGGEEVQCGWLRDRFGLSWQVVPDDMTKWINGPDPVCSARAMQAMMKMVKIDVDALRKAYEGNE